MDALTAIAHIRKSGMRPDCVLVEVGVAKQREWWVEKSESVTVAIPDGRPLREFDFRPLVSCDVIVLGDRSSRTKSILAKLCGYAKTVMALTSTDPDDIGHVWDQGKGWRKFGSGPEVE